ncbi:hypothetical protein C2R22_02440 [Salinigranum rubrum]|uniref:Uncharacterized protein n=1 Tax=Salinigranum rubrum TaxID=755307 RepID=A0A2I8VFE4_9EURY|nr:hypothetical protein [Salinigranum rubrum]AUV80653.1 hypothetical protein C2R22_02440 [Salinigranum rubrum]
MDWKEAVTHPLTALGAVLAYTAGMIDPIFTLVGQTAGIWFPLLGVIDSIGGAVPSIPAALTSKLFVGAALVYAAYLSFQLLGRVTTFFERDET